MTRIQADLVEQLADARGALAPRAAEVQAQDLADAVADALAPVERQVGVLEDDLDLARPAQALGRPYARGGALATGDQDGAAALALEPDEDAGDRGLARARLADDRQR